MLNILKFVILGAAAGSVLALLGIGVNVIYRASRVMNFSQAAIAVSAAYLYSDFVKFTSVWVALPLALVSGLLLTRVLARQREESAPVKVAVPQGVS